MDEEMKARLTSRDVWMRALYMIFFAITYSVAEVLVFLTVIFQFLVILFTGSANEQLMRFGQNLTRYIADIVRFETFNSEDKPFPLSDWPGEEPGGERWMHPSPVGADGGSGSETTAAPAAPEEPAVQNSDEKPDEDRPGQ